MSITQKRICSVLLVFCMLLTSIPGITAQMGTSQDLTISIDGILLKPEEGKVYYTNTDGKALTVEELTEGPDGSLLYNVHFNTQTNELVLNNYQGKAIHFSGSEPVNINVKIWGNNKIEDHTQGIGIANLTGGDLVITSEEESKLKIIQAYTDNQPIIYGIMAAKEFSSDQVGNVKIQGNVELEMDLEHKGNKEATVIGIFGKTVMVKEKANVNIKKMKTDFANTTRFSAAGIYAKESLKISTGRNIDINGKDTKKASYALYCEQDKINLDRAEQIIFEWKTVGSEGADSKPAAQYHKKNLHIFEKNTNKIKYGRPDWRTVTVINGQTDRADNQYFAGETVSISATGITVPFKEWEGFGLPSFTGGTSRTDAQAKLKMSDRNFEITATYDAFTDTPEFTSATGEITLPIRMEATISSPSAIFLILARGDVNNSHDIKKNIALVDLKDQKKTTITADQVSGGEYQLAVKIDNIWHYSRIFEIEWPGKFAASLTIYSYDGEEFGKDLNVVTEGIGSTPPNPMDLIYQWYRGDQLIHGANEATYKIQAEDIGKILKVEVSHKAKPGKVSKVTGEIKKGLPEEPDPLALTDVEVTHDSIAIKEDFWNAHPEYIYHLTKASNDEKVGSKENKGGENRVFDNLMPGKIYNLTVQKAENDYYVESKLSGVLQITTKEILSGTIRFDGELKYGKEIEAKVSNAPVKAASLNYKWQRVKNGMTEPLMDTTPKHQITAEDIDAELQVVITTTNKQYEGQISHKTAKVAKADGEAAPTLSVNNFVVTDSQVSFATPSSMMIYEFRKQGSMEWKSGNQKLENLMSDTEYQLEIRKKETATQKASDIQVLSIKTKKVDVSIRGILRFGETLTVEVSQDIINSGPVSYQWKRGGVDIAGATQKTYVLVKEDINQQISCQVTGVLGVYTKDANGLVEKAEQTAPAKPVLVAKTDKSITVKAEAGHEYKINKAGSNWQMAAVFTGLEPDTEYQIKARKAMTETHMVSPESEELTVKTEKEISKPKPEPKENLQPYTPAGSENTEIVKPQPQPKPKDEMKDSMNQSKDKPKMDEKDMSKEKNTMDKMSSFADVKKGEWFEKAVQFVHESELMQGTDTMHFQPNAEITRSQLVTVLHRMAGSPMPKASADFKDVESGSYYQNAVSWAKENEIVAGYGDGLFGTMDNVTREQLAVLLYRLANLTGKDTKMRADLSTFADAGEVSAFAKEALSWAKAAGYINGTDSNQLLPKGHATRAQIAAILMRYIQANK